MFGFWSDCKADSHFEREKSVTKAYVPNMLQRGRITLIIITEWIEISHKKCVITGDVIIKSIYFLPNWRKRPSHV